MLVDFQTIDLNDKPVLVLKTPSGKVLQTLGFAHKLESQFRFNEVSQITFEVPAYDNGEPVPNYDKLVGEMIIDMVGWGQFILQNPKSENDGIKEIKTCTAYSMEYELTHKQFPLEEGTYNFWNPASPEGTMLWLIVQCCPGWSVGSVDSELIGKYRTFDTIQDNAYNIMMNTLQKPYKCVFYFDTYRKKIHAVDATKDTATSPIFLSLDNLIKKIDIDEESENLVTVLDVNGADDVDIRSVNPLGTNKIYNLDYFMNETHFDKDVIKAWNNWKILFEERRQEYFALSVRRSMKTAEILTLQARLTDEQGVLSTYESEQAVNIQASMNGDETGQIALKLESLKEDVDKQNTKIASTTAEIEDLQTDNEAILAELKEIIEEVSFENNFTADQLQQLQPYFIEDSIAESTFAMVDTATFVDTSTTVTDKDIIVTVSDCELMKIAPRANFSGGTISEQIYSFTKGTLSLTYDSSAGEEITTYEITGEINRGSAERNGSKLVVTIALGSGAITNLTRLIQDGDNNSSMKFNKGTFALVGTYVSMDDDTAPDEDTPNVIYSGKSLACNATSADMYITSETTMMEQYAIEWDLYEYGEEQLKKLAYPTYTFKLDTSNFLALADFISFTSNLTLGRKNYVDIGDKVLKPILIGVDISFDDLASLSLTFSDTYNGGNNAFKLVDLLEQSVSMGHKLDVSKFSYNDYINSGAKTAVRDFITSALDASKNAVINGADQSTVFDESGLKLRKVDPNTGEYEDEQIWMINNNIVFTDDGWETAKMAIGHFTDTNFGDCWGIVAPNIVGTLIAGENLVIESPRTNIEGGPSATSLFRVDGDGVSMYNSRLEIINPLLPDTDMNPQYGVVLLDPDLGIGLGKYKGTYSTVSATNGEEINGLVQMHNGKKQWNVDNDEGITTEEGRVTFWVDMDGNLHFKGTLEGADGVFSGSLIIGDPENKKGNGAKGVYLDSEGNLAIGGRYSPDDPDDTHEPKAKFYVDNEGNMHSTSGSFEGDVHANNVYIWDPELMDWASLLDDHNKIKSKYIDLGNIILNGETGDVSIAGNIDLSGATSINFGTFTPGIEYEYSEDGESNWHSNKRTTDKYVRTVVVTQTPEGGERDPGPAIAMENDWPDYIQSTHIDLTQCASPNIMGNDVYAINFKIVPSFTQTSSGVVDPSTQLGTMGCMNGYDGEDSTTGIGLRRDDNHYVICTTQGVRMQSGGVGVSGAVCAMENSAYMNIGSANVDVTNQATINGSDVRPAGAAMYYGNSYFRHQGMVEVNGDGAFIKYSTGTSAIEVKRYINIATSDGLVYLDAHDGVEVTSDTGSFNVTSHGMRLDASNNMCYIAAAGVRFDSSQGFRIDVGPYYNFGVNFNSVPYIYADADTAQIRYGDSGTYCWVRSNFARMAYQDATLVECNNQGVFIVAGGRTCWFDSNGLNGADSDRKLKYDIKDNVDGDLVDELTPVEFKFKGTDKIHYGFIAQDVQEVIPEIVASHEIDGEPRLGIAYTEIIPFLTAKVQKLTRQIERLESQIAGMRGDE